MDDPVRGLDVGLHDGRIVNPYPPVYNRDRQRLTVHRRGAVQPHHLVRRQFEVGLATSLDLATASTELAAQRNAQVLEQLMFEINALALNKSIGDYHALSSDVTDWTDR